MNTCSLILSAILLCSIAFALFFNFYHLVDKTVKHSESKSSTHILETYVSGYDIISKFSINVLKIKPDIFLSISILFYIMRMTVNITSKRIWTLVSWYLMSMIIIEFFDDLYFLVMDWVTKQHIVRNAHSLQIRATAVILWDYWDRVKNNINSSSSYDLSDWELKVPLTYESDYEMYFLWHDRWLFWISQCEEYLSLMRESMKKDKILLTCIGWSTNSIKDLIQHCHEIAYVKQKVSTSIHFSLTKKLRVTDQSPWAHRVLRHSRPIDMISLNMNQKSRILQDLTKFLHLNTRLWYHEHGILYHQGHLYFRPSDTGKTSISFAITGEFRLVIHCILLSDSTLTDEDLELLF